MNAIAGEPSRVSSAPRRVEAGPWRAKLHPPVLVYRGTRDEHITRPNLCVFRDGVIGAIFQTTFDTNATPTDRKHVCVSTDAGQSWHVAARDSNIGSYSLISKSAGEVVVMPYDSIRFGPDPSSLTGPRTTLRWDGAALQLRSDTTLARFPRPLMGFVAEPIMDDAGRPLYLQEDLPPADKPITAFWGTIQRLDDGRWIAPAYGSYASDPHARTSPAPEMRRMARFTSELLVSDDEGRNWNLYSRIAAPADVPDDCVEGPSEVQLFRFDAGGHWRAIFRTSALKNFFQPMRYADSFDAGKTWTKPRVLPDSVEMIMDPRGLQLPGGVTVLSAGRPKIDLYLAAGASLDFHALDLTAHHNACLPRLRTTGHTDVVPLGSRSLLFVYDYIPDSWRWPGSPFTAPDAIYTVRIDLE